MDPVLKGGINLIQQDYINHVIEYLKTGSFNPPSTTHFLTAYAKVMELVDKSPSQYAKILYSVYTKTITKYHSEYTIPLIMSKSGKELLWEFMTQWEKHSILTYWLNKIFNYLERMYMLGAHLGTLSQTGLSIFKKHVFDKLNATIVKTIFEEIEAEREGEMIDWNKLKKVLYCYRTMGISNASVEKDPNTGEIIWLGNVNIQYYKEMFEGEFIKQTKDFYRKQSERWLQSVSCSEYVNLAYEALEKEEDKVLSFLDKDTRPRLISALQDVLVNDKAQLLVEKEQTGVASMLKDNKTAELKKMYELFLIRPHTLTFICKELRPDSETRGKLIIDNSEFLKDPVVFIGKIMDLKREMDYLVQGCFHANGDFIQVRDRAFQDFMNDCPYTPIDYCKAHPYHKKQKII